MKSEDNEVNPPYLHSFSPSNYMEVHPDKYSVTIKANRKSNLIADPVSSKNKM